MRIDFERSELAEIGPIGAASDLPEVSVGDLLLVKRTKGKKPTMRVVDDEQAHTAKGWVLRVDPGPRKGTAVLAVAARDDVPDVEFGDFEFEEIAAWMIANCTRMGRWIVKTLEQQEMTAIQESDASLMIAVDYSYLSVLALCVKYSLIDDSVDGPYSSADLLNPDLEASRRAHAMLQYHAKALPPNLSCAETFNERLNVTRHMLIPIALGGFDFPVSTCAELERELPRELKRFWKAHEQADRELCQFMIAAFYFTFRAWVPELTTWDELIEAFWNGWEDLLLDVEGSLQNGTLHDDETLP